MQINFICIFDRNLKNFRVFYFKNLNKLESNLIFKAKELINNKIFRRIDRKILVYLVFVGISTVFWFLNELSNDYNSTINYPVRFTNLPKNKILVSDLPKNLNLSVNAYGYTLLRYKLSPASFPVIINMEKYGGNIANPSVNKFRLQTRYTREAINKQLNNDVEVLDILPDTILFQFANIISKKVPIKPLVKLEFDEQCMLNGTISFTPDSIVVKGPNNILDTLSAVYTRFSNFDKLNKPLQRNVALKEINKLTFNKKRVVMQIPVSKFTQADFDVPIQPKNVPDSLDLKSFPRIAKVTCLVSLEEYDKIQTKDFLLEIDFYDIEKLLGNKLTVTLGISPTNAKNVAFFPESVEFILDKKQ